MHRGPFARTRGQKTRFVRAKERILSKRWTDDALDADCADRSAPARRGVSDEGSANPLGQDRDRARSHGRATEIGTLHRDFVVVEALAWRKQERIQSQPISASSHAPVGPPISKIRGAAYCSGAPVLSMDPLGRYSGFRVIPRQSSWHLQSLIASLKPSATLRPGKRQRGRFGFQRLDHPPTSHEICKFAEVEFPARRR